MVDVVYAICFKIVEDGEIVDHIVAVCETKEDAEKMKKYIDRYLELIQYNDSESKIYKDAELILTLFYWRDFSIGTMFEEIYGKECFIKELSIIKKDKVNDVIDYIENASKDYIK